MRASTVAPRDSPAAIAAASRNAIQEAKNRKAAARARMAQRRNAPVRNQGGEGDDAAQAEPAGSMQDSPLRHEPHAWLLQALAESHSTNGSESAADEIREMTNEIKEIIEEISPSVSGYSWNKALSDTLVAQAVADPAEKQKLVAFLDRLRNLEPGSRPLQVVNKPLPRRKNEYVETRVVVHPADFEAYRAGGDGELFLRLSDGAADESSGWVYQAVADSGIVPGAVGMWGGQQALTGFGLGTAPTVQPWPLSPDAVLKTLHISCAPTSPLAAGKFCVVDEKSTREWLATYYTGLVVKEGHIFTMKLLKTEFTSETTVVLTVARLEFAGEESLSFGQIAATTSMTFVKAADAGDKFILRGPPRKGFAAFLSGVAFVILLFAGLSAALSAVSWALAVGWRLVSSVFFLGPVFAFARFLSDAVVGSVPYRFLRCVFRAYVRFDLFYFLFWNLIYGVTVPKEEKEYTPMEMPENAGPLGTAFLLSFEWGVNALGMYLNYRAAAKALAWCKYLADPHAHVEGGIPAEGP